MRRRKVADQRLLGLFPFAGRVAPEIEEPLDRVENFTQWPQRTQPSEILSWSGTTLNIVPQAGQRVIRLIARL